MVPYIHIPDVPIGGLSLHPFGILVATGVVLGTWLTMWRARQRGLDTDELNSFITWMLIAGFMGGHMLDEIFYHPDELVKRPWSIFFLWEGLSSFGGFIGGFIGIILWKYYEAVPMISLGFLGTIHSFRKRKKPRPVLPLCDLIISVFPVAWIFGRSGCTVVHDHPGAIAENFALAVGYPARGIPTPDKTLLGFIELSWGPVHRFDMGLLELLFTIGISCFFVLTWRRKLPTGSYLAAVALAYAPVRFVMDFFRIQEGSSADPRYGALTPAQYACLFLFVVGLGLIKVCRDNAAKAREGRDPLDVYRLA